MGLGGPRPSLTKEEAGIRGICALSEVTGQQSGHSNPGSGEPWAPVSRPTPANPVSVLNAECSGARASCVTCPQLPGTGGSHGEHWRTGSLRRDPGINVEAGMGHTVPNTPPSSKLCTSVLSLGPQGAAEGCNGNGARERQAVNSQPLLPSLLHGAKHPRKPHL